MGHSAHQAQGQESIRRRRNGACSASAHVNIIGQEWHKTIKRAKTTAVDNNTHMLRSSEIQFSISQ